MECLPVCAYLCILRFHFVKINVTMSTISLIIKPTNACNMRCKHCYHSNRGYDNRGMSVSVFEDICIKTSIDYDRINIIWHGGEPTLMGVDFYEHIVSIENHILEKNNVEVRNFIQTNASLIDEYYIDFFNKNDFNVSISFDGPFNNELREQTDVIEHSMTLMKKKGMRYGCIVVVTSRSINKLDKLYDWCVEHEQNIKINPIFNEGLATERPDLLINEAEYVNNIVNLFERWLYDTKCNFIISSFEELIFKERKTCHHSSCLYRWLGFDNQGYSYPCGRSWPSHYRLGNIGDVNNITEFFEKPAYLEIVQNSVAHRENCKNECNYSTYCQGGCVASIINNNGAIDKNSWDCIVTQNILKKIVPLIEKIEKDVHSGNLSQYNPMLLDSMKKMTVTKFEKQIPLNNV